MSDTNTKKEKVLPVKRTEDGTIEKTLPPEASGEVDQKTDKRKLTE